MKNQFEDASVDLKQRVELKSEASELIPAPAREATTRIVSDDVNCERVPGAIRDDQIILVEYRSSRLFHCAMLCVIGGLPAALGVMGLMDAHKAHSAAAGAIYSIMGLIFSATGFGFVGWGLYQLVRERAYIWLELSKKGIRFSNIWNLETAGNNERTWSDVKSVHLTGFSGPKFLDRIRWNSLNYYSAKPQLQFRFKSGGSAHIKLPLVTREQATTIVESICHYTGTRALSSDVVRLKEALLCQTTDMTFTELWQQDLEMRHGATHFAPLPPGQRLSNNQYTVLSEMSTGGLSAVYLAKNAGGEKVVLKESVLPLDTADAVKQKAREMFKREASILMKLNVPQTAKVLDQFVEDERDYIVTEYVPGKTLRQLVAKSGTQTERQTLEWCSQIAKILSQLHQMTPPIVHRDVTPDNIVLADDGKIVLIDFGAANEYVGNATGTMVGKQAYIAPEQFRGKGEPRSDIYSLGATAYFLLTAKDPLPLSESIPKQRNSLVSDGCNKLIESSTSTELGERVASATEFARSAQRLMSGESN